MSKLSERIALSMTPELLARLEAEAIKTHVTMPPLLRQLLTEALDERSRRPAETPELYEVYLNLREQARLYKLGYRPLTLLAETEEPTNDPSAEYTSGA